MKKVLVYFAILVVLCTMFISVYAAPLSVIRQPSDLVVSPQNGIYSFSLSFLVNNAVSYQWYYSADNNNWFISEWGSATTDTLSQQLYNVDLNSVRFFKCVATNSDGDSITSRVVTVEFVRSRFQYYSTSALRYVTRWVSSVVNSLTEGPLSGLLPVLAIGIAVAALLIVIKIIKLFGWGV